MRSSAVSYQGRGARPCALFVALVLLVLAAATSWSCGDSRPEESSTREDASAQSEHNLGTVEPGELDVVLITIDTLRADAVGYAAGEDGAGHGATPTIDRLARGGRVFHAAHAHNVVTLPSHANILTGRYPYQHGVRDNSGFVLPNDVPTLATLLRREGYRTGAFVGAYPLDSRYGLDRGFEVYDDRYPKGSHPSEFVMPERRGDEVVAAGLAWWREHAGERRFLWLHLYDPHAPYEPPEPFRSRYPDNPYRGEVAAVDAYLEPLLAPILDGEDEPALVILTADHGEAFGEHGETTHGLFAYQPTLAVPLVLWGPNVAPGAETRPVGHVDLLPTVLDALGLEPPADLPGQTLLAELEPRDLYFEALSSYLNQGWAPLYGLLRGENKYVDLPLPELYDLAADPEESNNLLTEKRRLFRELRDALPETAREVAPRKVSAEEAARLRALGYAASSAPAPDRFTADDDPKRLVALDNRLKKIAHLYNRGQLREAETLAREVIAARPTMARTYEVLAEILRQDGRVEQAVVELEGALAAGVEHPSIPRQLGLALAETGRGREAVALLEPLAGSGDLDVLNALGVAYYAAGAPARARVALDRVLETDPENVKALESLGAVALQERRPEEAVRHLERALALDDQLPITWNTLGVARQFLGDVDGALDAWQRAADLDPAFLDPLYNLGRIAAGAGRRDLARAALSRYLELASPERHAADRAVARQILAALDGG